MIQCLTVMTFSAILLALMTAEHTQATNSQPPAGSPSSAVISNGRGAADLELGMKRYACAVYRDEPLEVRLWGRVAINDKTGCWEWTGARKTAKGKPAYGTIRCGHITTPVHRVAYEMLVGPIPPGMFVCHTCDNTICVRPDHWFLGTNRDNMADRRAKGRYQIGSEHPTSKLTEADVIYMRQVREGTGMTYERLGRMFGISRTQARCVIRGVWWRHLAESTLRPDCTKGPR